MCSCFFSVLFCYSVCPFVCDTSWSVLTSSYLYLPFHHHHNFCRPLVATSSTPEKMVATDPRGVFTLLFGIYANLLLLSLVFVFFLQLPFFSMIMIIVVVSLRPLFFCSSSRWRGNNDLLLHRTQEQHTTPPQPPLLHHVQRSSLSWGKAPRPTLPQGSYNAATEAASLQLWGFTDDKPYILAALKSKVGEQ